MNNWNLPDGVSLRDIDAPENKCVECGRECEGEMCGRCERKEDEDDEI